LPGCRAHKNQGAHGGILNFDTPLHHAQGRQVAKAHYKMSSR
jgi:hypothetical protein